MSTKFRAAFFAMAALAPLAIAWPTPTPIASACVNDCKQCVGVIVNGQILQTCPDGYTSGGFFCKISVNSCQTVGVCTSGG